jgi:hypothetical protein
MRGPDGKPQLARSVFPKLTLTPPGKPAILTPKKLETLRELPFHDMNGFLALMG